MNNLSKAVVLLVFVVFFVSMIAMFIVNIKVTRWRMWFVNTSELRRLAWWGVAWLVVALTSITWLLFGTNFLPPGFDSNKYKVVAISVFGLILLTGGAMSFICLWETRKR